MKKDEIVWFTEWSFLRTQCLSKPNQNESQPNQCWMRQYCIIHSTCICFASISVKFIPRIFSDGYYKYDEIQLSNIHNSNIFNVYFIFRNIKWFISYIFFRFDIPKNFFKLLRLFAVVVGIQNVLLRNKRWSDQSFFGWKCQKCNGKFILSLFFFLTSCWSLMQTISGFCLIIRPFLIFL